MSYDSILKFWIDEYTQPILSWLLNTPVEEKVEILKTELNVEPIRADGVFFLAVGQKIIHLEFQTNPQSEPPLPLRMLDYWVRLYRLYQPEKEIEQVIIFLQRTTSEKVFEDSFQVGNTLHRYRVIRIWECAPNSLLSQPELLPLAVLAKSEQPQVLLSQVAERIDRIENKRKQSNIAACVELLAGINYSEELIAMYLQEDILKESVIYQKIINEGIQQGLQQGEQRGEASLIIRILSRRFGTVEEARQERIRQLSVPQLEELGESLLDFSSLSDLISWLDKANSA